MIPKTIYQGDWLLPLDGPPLQDGWICVEGNGIEAIGTAENLPAHRSLVKSAEVKRFPGCALLPGFINAHCHLELTSLHNRLPIKKSFPDWVDALRGLTAAFDSSDYRDAARKGINLLLRGGATTVVDVGNTGEALSPLAESPLRAFGLVETLGIDPTLAQSRYAQAAALAERSPGTSKFRTGVTPHAAYSCSAELLKTVLHHQRIGRPFTHYVPFSLHASESREEADLFSKASGPLQDFCRRIFADAPEHRATTSIRWLDSHSLLPEHALIVHGNHLDAKDIALLANRKATVVHCPSSHAFFGHKPFPYPELHAQGVHVCLGTDSLASGDSLSMLEQIRLFRKNFPEATLQEALRMATTVAAQALGVGNELGFLRAGFKADFIAVPLRTRTSSSNTAPPDFPEAHLNMNSEIAFSVIDGEEIRA